jgi:hypothetical protein
LLPLHNKVDGRVGAASVTSASASRAARGGSGDQAVGCPPGLLSGADERDGVVVGRLSRLVGHPLGIDDLVVHQKSQSFFRLMSTSPRAFLSLLGAAEPQSRDA